MADDEVDWGMEESVEVDEWRQGGVEELGLAADDEDVISLAGDEEEVKPTSPRKTPSTTNGSSIPTGPSKGPPTGPRKPTSVNRRSLGNVPTGPRSDSRERIPSQSQAAQGKDQDDDKTSKPAEKDSSKEKEEPQPLPEGWAEIMSKTHNRPFWFHQASNTTSWKRPTETTRPPTPPPPETDDVHRDAKELKVDTKVKVAEEVATPALADQKSARGPPTGPSKAEDPVVLSETGRRNFVPLGYNPNRTAAGDRRRGRSPSPGRPTGDDRRNDPKRFRREGEQNSSLPPSGPRNDALASERRRSPPNGIPQGPRDRRSPPPGPGSYTSRGPERRAYGEDRSRYPNRGGFGSGPNSIDPRPSSAHSDARGRDGRGSLTSRMAPPPSDADTEARRAKLAEEKRAAEEKIRQLAEEEARLAKEAAARKEREERDEKARKAKEQEDKELLEWRAKREEERKREDAERARGEGEYRTRPGRGPPPREPVRPAPPSATSSYDSYRPGGKSPPRAVPLTERLGRRPDFPPSPPRRRSPPPIRPFDEERGMPGGGSSYRPSNDAPSPPRERFRDARERDFRDARDADRRPRGTFAEPMSSHAQAASRMRPRSPPPPIRDVRGPPPMRFEQRPLVERMSRPPPGENGFGGRDDDRRSGQPPPRRML